MATVADPVPNCQCQTGFLREGGRSGQVDEIRQAPEGCSTLHPRHRTAKTWRIRSGQIGAWRRYRPRIRKLMTPTK